MYHSYKVTCLEDTLDFNGHNAVRFDVVLGGEDANEVYETLTALLDFGLDKPTKKIEGM